MPDPTRLYVETLSLLRSVTARHAGVLQMMTSGASGPAAAWSFERVETLATEARRVEDEGIGAVCHLSTLSDRETAVRAVNEAGAAWLLDVILNRAAETTRAGGRA